MNDKRKKNEQKKEDPELKMYLLKDIEGSVWDKFAVRARGLRLNIKEAMQILVTQFANGDIEFKRSDE